MVPNAYNRSQKIPSLKKIYAKKLPVVNGRVLRERNLLNSRKNPWTP
jgi:hypothetical protein